MLGLLILYLQFLNVIKNTNSQSLPDTGSQDNDVTNTARGAVDFPQSEANDGMMGVSVKDSSCALFDINCNDSALMEYSSRSNRFGNIAV